MKNAKQVAVYGLFIALIYIATNINIPGPTPGGLFHLGNIVAFTVAIVWGRRAGAVSAAIGMGLFDLLSPYAVWAPFTFIIRLSMGYVLGSLANRKNEENKSEKAIYLAFGLILSTIIMIVGYYIAEVILYHNYITPVQSIFGNLMQCVVGTIGAIPLSLALKTGFKARNMDLNI